MTIPSANPLITIVTATFNALAGLQETVASVAAQTFGSVEHVIVDGGSSDGTQEYLASLGDRVRWISEADDGIADAMNKGVAMAQGEYVLVLHAEDYFTDAESLQSASEYLAQGKDIVSYNVETIADGHRRIYQSRGFSLKAEFFATVPHQGALCRKDLFDRIGGFDAQYRVAMDYDFMLRAKRRGASILCVDQTLAVMPATGVSARLDWPSLRRRLAENRSVQRREGQPILAPLRAAFWIVYPIFKRTKVALLEKDS